MYENNVNVGRCSVKEIETTCNASKFDFDLWEFGNILFLFWNKARKLLPRPKMENVSDTWHIVLIVVDARCITYGVRRGGKSRYHWWVKKISFPSL